jgi:hypothetical protein
MQKIIHLKISIVEDSDFQLLVDELCQSIFLDKNDVLQHTFSFLLMAIVREKKKMDLNNVLVSRILDTKVGKLSFNSIVYSVCCELVALNNSHIEFYSGKSVFTLIKECHKFYRPKKNRIKKLSSWLK